MKKITLIALLSLLLPMLASSVDKYNAASTWSGFGKIVAIED